MVKGKKKINKKAIKWTKHSNNGRQYSSKTTDSLPSVVLRVEQEVGADNSDTHSDHHHDKEHQEHEAKHIVHLVLPEGREDKVPASDTTGYLIDWCELQSNIST